MAFDRSEFLSTFNDEARDHLQQLNNGLLKLEKNPDDPGLIEEMFREGHTLKGAARMMGFDEIKEVAHRIEDIFGAIHTKKIHLDETLSTLLFTSLDVITAILGEVVSGKAVTTPWKDCVTDLESTYQAYLAGEKKKPVTGKKEKKAPAAKAAKSPPPADESPSPEASGEVEEELSFEDVRRELEAKGLLNVPLDVYTDDSASHQAERETPMEPRGRSSEASAVPELEEFIKVPINKINKLLNLVGEMVINKINSNQKLNTIRRLMKLSRLSYKKLGEFASLTANHPALQGMHILNDMRLSFHEVNSDLLKIRDETNHLYDDISVEVSQLDPIIDELQLRMKQIRMLPVGTVFETMPRLVRDIAVAQGKKIELEISGEETELDKKVLESIKGALIHLLRNSVDHGIELPQDRTKAGKNTKGMISLRAFHKGGNVIIEIEDDGRGMDFEKIREIGVRKGLVTPDEAATMSESEILNFIFLPGFSTAPIITDISGRGVGLDVVRTDIENLKGNIAITTDKGRGTCFTLQLPLTVAIIQALLVQCHGDVFAIPLLSVEESITLKKDEIRSIENRQAIRLRNRTISVVALETLLGLPTPVKKENTPKKDSVFIVILNSMEKLLGIIVDEIKGEQEIFIKSLDPKFGKLVNVSGATVLGSGQVIIILDILDLFESAKMSGGSVRTVVGPADPKASHQRKRILIAEDSLTTRELERSILESHGYEVDTAIDGLDALNKIQSESYDLVVSDIEMPKMEGFELCRAIRKNPNLKDLPVVILTSLDREEDKRRGIEVGAQAYIVKSAFDQSSLIDTVKRLIG